MRYFISILTVLMIVSGAAFAQNDAVDEFAKFQEDLRNAGRAKLPSAEPQVAAEAETSPPADYQLSAETGAKRGDATMMLEYAQEMERRGDPVEAYKWYLLAQKFSRGTNREVTLAAAVRARTQLGLSLTVEQQAEARQSSDVWRPETVSQEKDTQLEGMVIAESKITAVTVYSDRAKVTRVAEVDIPAGAKVVAFKDLPFNLLTDSLRAQGMARADVKFGAVSSKTIITTRDASPNTAPFYEKLQALKDQIQVIHDEEAAIGERKAFLEKIGDQARLRTDEDFAELNLKPEQWVAAADVIFNNALASKKQLMELGLKARELEREKDKITAKLMQLNAPVERRNIFTVLVPVESAKATRIGIELSYQIPNATWQPIYDARVDTKGKGSLSLTQYGSVRQQTGEDWKDVALTLSTAQPQRGASLADLQPMWISAWENNMPTGMVRVVPGTDNSDDDYKRMVMKQNATNAQYAVAEGTSAMPTPVDAGERNTLDLPPGRGDPLQEWRQKTEAKRLAMEYDNRVRPVAFTPAQIETGGFMSEYKIPGPSTVPMDGTNAKLLIGNFDADSKVQVHIKPQISTEAYLVARTKLKGETPVLPGPVSLFRDDAYVGQSRLALMRPGEDFNFYFGVDDQVSVKHKTLKNENKESGLISKDRIIEKQFITEIKNLHTDPIDIVVQETTPVSKHEKVAVEISPDTTQGYKPDTDNIKGLLEWGFTMEPKQGKDLKLGWQVKWPNDYSIEGIQ